MKENNQISPHAVISESAEIGKNVKIGPFCIIGPHVKIGDDCELHSNVVIEGDTIIGKGNEIFHSAVIGSKPQDLKYKGELTRVRIGDNNKIREFVTINPGTDLEEDTEIGSNNLLMAYVHVGHQCHIGNHIIIANSVNIAGHVYIYDGAIIGGMTGIHQFVKIGKGAFVGGASGVKKDIPPFTRGEGMPYKVKGLNLIGLRRKKVPKEELKSLKEIYKLFYKSGINFADAAIEAAEMDLTPTQKEFVDFAKKSDRGLCLGS